jgi:hypothetical protein
MQTREDRMALIKAAAEKLQAKQAGAFKTKVQAKGRKTVKNATEGAKTIKGLEAFEEDFMYDNEKAIAKVWNDSGVVDSYRDTIRYDNEWN